MNQEQDFSHLDEQGKAKMVDVGRKPPLFRRAVAEGWIVLTPKTIEAIQDKEVPKGDVLSVARVAGIMAAKKTEEIIPLCHSLPLDQVTIDFTLQKNAIHIQTEICCTAKTGVEMEALTAVSVAALTIYDMCKAVDKEMRIEGIHLVNKEKQENPSILV